MVMAEQQEQFVAFRAGGFHLAAPIAQVKEVVRVLPVTPLPSGPPFLEGIVELRGAVLPVMDLRKRLGQAVGPPTDAERFLIASLGGTIFALVADEVIDVLRIPVEQIRPAPLRDEMSAIDRVFRHGDTLYLVLSLDRLLNSEEEARLAELARTLAQDAGGADKEDAR